MKASDVSSIEYRISKKTKCSECKNIISKETVVFIPIKNFIPQGILCDACRPPKEGE